MAILSFLKGLPPQFETAKAQALSGSDICFYKKPLVGRTVLRVLHLRY